AGPGEVDDFLASHYINLSVGSEDAEHDAVGPRLPKEPDVLLHGLELQVAVAEVTASGPDHDIHGNFTVLSGCLEGSQRRGRAPLEEVGAELHAVGTPGLGSQYALNRFQTNLN